MVSFPMGPRGQQEVLWFWRFQPPKQASNLPS